MINIDTYARVTIRFHGTDSKKAECLVEIAKSLGGVVENRARPAPRRTTARPDVSIAATVAATQARTPTSKVEAAPAAPAASDALTVAPLEPVQLPESGAPLHAQYRRWTPKDHAAVCKASTLARDLYKLTCTLGRSPNAILQRPYVGKTNKSSTAAEPRGAYRDRRTYTKDEAYKLWTEWRTSGLSKAKFIRKNKLPVTSTYNWFMAFDHAVSPAIKA